MFIIKNSVLPWEYISGNPNLTIQMTYWKELISNNENTFIFYL
jgi:hypothetical protein